MLPEIFLKIFQRDEVFNIDRQEEVPDAQELRLAFCIGVGQTPEKVPSWKAAEKISTMVERP